MNGTARGARLPRYEHVSLLHTLIMLDAGRLTEDASSSLHERLVAVLVTRLRDPRESALTKVCLRGRGSVSLAFSAR